MSKNLDEWSNFCHKFQSYIIACLKIKESLSQSKVAEIMQVDQATISRIENEEQGRDISHSMLKLLFIYFPKENIMNFTSPGFIEDFHNNFIIIHRPSAAQEVKLNQKAHNLVNAATIIQNL
ncbi:MAG: transcriptional regulator with XRE-family HTH domain [Bacteriovoracaceae bacterium]|jgi:transcriptional regulator with XRE-family HTH domain